VLHCRVLPPFAPCDCNSSFGVMRVSEVCDQEDPTAYPGQVGVTFFIVMHTVFQHLPVGQQRGRWDLRHGLVSNTFYIQH